MANYSSQSCWPIRWAKSGYTRCGLDHRGSSCRVPHLPAPVIMHLHVDALAWISLDEYKTMSRPSFPFAASLLKLPIYLIAHDEGFYVSTSNSRHNTGPANYCL